MALQKGETYGCGTCGCEIEVTQGPREGAGGNENPRCCCGEEMTRK